MPLQSCPHEMYSLEAIDLLHVHTHTGILIPETINVAKINICGGEKLQMVVAQCRPANGEFSHGGKPCWVVTKRFRLFMGLGDTSRERGWKWYYHCLWLEKKIQHVIHTPEDSILFCVEHRTATKTTTRHLWKKCKSSMSGRPDQSWRWMKG